jgi:hypothetical protein
MEILVKVNTTYVPLVSLTTPTWDGVISLPLPISTLGVLQEVHRLRVVVLGSRELRPQRTKGLDARINVARHHVTPDYFLPVPPSRLFREHVSRKPGRVATDVSMIYRESNA